MLSRITSTLRTDIASDNVVTVWMDASDRPVNTCSLQFLSDLTAAWDEIERTRPPGVIFASAKPGSFNAGADLFELRDLARDRLQALLELGQRLFQRIAGLNVPTVAAINGDCLGGGYELALACRYRVAAGDPSISIGLPEVKLGLIPAWGGTTRLPRAIGLRAALPLLLAAKTLSPLRARRTGLVDEVVRPEALLTAARRLLQSQAPPRAAPRIDRLLARIGPLRARVLEGARRRTLALTHGNYPAPLRLLQVVDAGHAQGLEAGLIAERQAIRDLCETEVVRNSLRLFFLRQDARRRAAAQLQAEPREVRQAAVIGGGTMGAGIVHALIRAGIPVRLVEVDPPAVSAALGRIQRMLQDDVAAGRLESLGAQQALHRVSPTTDWTGIEVADIAVEAVVEHMDAKRAIFARLGHLTRPTAVLATNTSALSVSALALATAHPARVVGLHFFNPVPKMPLVEVVRGDQSDEASLATAVALAGRLKKTPVLVRDSPGFLVNRMLLPYLAEGLSIAGDSIPVSVVDDAARRWGMPMGPFQLLDEIGLDLALHVLASLAGTPSIKAVAALECANAHGWLGKKSGRGFYVYDASRRRRPQVNADLTAVLSAGTHPAVPEVESIQRRLILPMVDEAARALQEGVADSADAVDLASVLGLGLAPFRGGVLRFGSTVGRVPRYGASQPDASDQPAIHR